MLEKSLPTLREKILQNLKKLPRLKQKQKSRSRNQNPSKTDSNNGPNLISNFQPIITPSKMYLPEVSSLSKFIIFLCVTLGLLLTLNLFLFIRIDKLKESQDSLSRVVSSLVKSEQEAVTTDRKIIFYKQTLSQRRLLLPRLSFVYQNITSGVGLEALRLMHSDFEITAKALNVYDFIKLTMNFLSGDYVSEIILKSANFNAQTKEYEFTIGGVFK